VNPVTRFRYHPAGTLASRASLFAVGPAISVVTPLIAIPVIVRVHGPGAWTAVAIGQSVGALGALLVSLSWPQLGPLVIARADAGERPQIVADSMGSRLLMLAALAVPLTVTGAVLSPPGARIVAALSAVAAAGAGLTFQWYYVGIGAPGRLVLNEAVVRVFATIAACGALLLGAGLIVYPLALLGAVAVSLLLNMRGTGTAQYRHRWWHWAGVVDDWRRHRSTVVSRLVQGGYYSGSTALVAAVSPAAATLFAVLDKVTKSVVNGAVSFPQALTSWVVARHSGQQAVRRVKAGLVIDSAFCLALALLTWSVLPIAVTYLLAGAYTVSGVVRVLVAVVVGLTVFNRAIRMHALLALGLEKYSARLTLATSCIGCVTLTLGLVWGGVVGSQAGLVVAEAVLAAGGLGRVLTALRRPDDRG
jgi:O-antigen/teichoic acid export membrane protein